MYMYTYIYVYIHVYDMCCCCMWPTACSVISHKLNFFSMNFSHDKIHRTAIRDFVLLKNRRNNCNPLVCPLVRCVGYGRHPPWTPSEGETIHILKVR